MARAGISYHDVEKAIVTIQGQRLNPSVDRVREVLKTGSRSTIAKYLREWKTTHGLSADDTATLPQELLSLVQSLWAGMQNKCGAELQHEREQVGQEAQRLRQQLHEVQQQYDTLQDRHQKLDDLQQPHKRV